MEYPRRARLLFNNPARARLALWIYFPSTAQRLDGSGPLLLWRCQSWWYLGPWLTQAPVDCLTTARTGVAVVSMRQGLCREWWKNARDSGPRHACTWYLHHWTFAAADHFHLVGLNGGHVNHRPSGSRIMRASCDHWIFRFSTTRISCYCN